MTTQRIGRTLLVAALTLGAGLAEAAERPPANRVDAERMPDQPIVGRRDNLGTAVGTPAEDLNIKKTEIPPVLLRAGENPYDLRGMNACQGIGAEVVRLDAALGPDQDEPEIADERSLNQKRGNTAASVLRTGVEAVTPYRGVIRRITGAAAYEKRVQTAVEAGFARRGFLKGMAIKMNCAPPASPGWFKPVQARAPARAPARRR